MGHSKAPCLFEIDPPVVTLVNIIGNGTLATGTTSAELTSVSTDE